MQASRPIHENLTAWRDPAERLRKALDKDELALFGQPIAALSGEVRFPMAEVLIRLREEEKAMLPPGEFLPVFEHYRLMPALDRWVVRKVVEHIARGSRVAQFTVNVASQTIEDADYPRAVADALVTSGVPGTALFFELSENDVLARLEATARFARGVRAVGCGVIVAGFGRRAASFQPLKTLHPEFVKIDGSLVRRILAPQSSEPKIKAILRVGEAMHYQSIAEMVEDQDILVRLKALGVAYAQGFGIQEPHPIEKLAR